MLRFDSLKLPYYIGKQVDIGRAVFDPLIYAGSFKLTNYLKYTCVILPPFHRSKPNRLAKG